ncbi:hypothetical protein [Roseofilum sp. Guam]|uniref:hypothetical protein n=1 Tax=Roseofilum sp. Guam TaxID=2821502 RepID=UPI001B0DD3F4|nr:hypothetical protein [Roseofilum sp. Guam]MBP0030910.1 hypothetical protein [Roseofilum sp. Guam]
MSILQNCLKAFSFVGVISIFNIAAPVWAANYLQFGNDKLSIGELEDFAQTGNLNDLSPEVNDFLEFVYGLSKDKDVAYLESGYELGFEYFLNEIHDKLNQSIDTELSMTLNPAELQDFIRTGKSEDLPPDMEQQLRDFYDAYKHEEFESKDLIEELQFNDFVEDMYEQLNRPIDVEPHLPLDRAEDQLLDLLFNLMGVSESESQTALNLMAENAQGETLIHFLRDLPGETITRDNFLQNLQNYTSPIAQSLDKILYLNSTRGYGTGNFGSFRQPIANALDNYKGGTVFDVDFVQTHVSGNLASWLNSKPLGYYDQIWFDSTIYSTSLLNQDDLLALNTWAVNKQPEFILDSAFFFRNRISNSLTASASAATVNQALALQNAGGGIFIGTDHNQFAYTANQILSNFGFDGFFTGAYHITPNASFVGDLLLDPEPVSSDLFTNNLQGLSTSYVPVGTHVLNENGGNRTIEIYEQLYSYSPGKVVHIGASFRTDIESVPEPGTVGSLIIIGVVGLGQIVSRKRKGA